MATYTTEDNKLIRTVTKYREDGTTYDVVDTYERPFLESQVVAITAQRDDMIAAKQAELDDVNTLLAQCDTLGVTTE
jgi:hypothetical protein